MRRLSLTGTSMAAAGLAVAFLAGPAFAATWSIVPTQAVGTQSTLAAADAVSATDGWAVGANTSTGGLVERWNGQRFTATASPDLLANHDGSAFAGLNGVDALSGGSAFAVGTSTFYGSDGLSHSSAVAERWNGSSWTRMSVPNTPAINSFTDVKAFSATDVWAVGRAGDTFSGATLAMHWNGTTWTRAATASPGTRDNYLTGVAGSGPNDIWAVGYYRDLPYGNRARHSLALHWNGSTWSRVATPDVGPIQTFLRDVVVLSPTNAWAVGYASGGINGTAAVVLHWNGSTWSTVTPPPLGTLTSVTAPTSTDIWVTGASATDGTPALANWRGSTWITNPAPLPGSPPFAALAGTTSTGNTLIAVGYTSTPATGASAPLAVRATDG